MLRSSLVATACIIKHITTCIKDTLKYPWHTRSLVKIVKGDRIILASLRVEPMNQNMLIFPVYEETFAYSLPISKICNTYFIPLVQMNNLNTYILMKYPVLTKYTPQDEVA